MLRQQQWQSRYGEQESRDDEEDDQLKSVPMWIVQLGYLTAFKWR